MNLYDVIKKPIITESSMALLEEGKYVFEVDTRAHKLLIKQAVEAAFDGVKVANVNTINVKPKAKRVGRYTSCLVLKQNNLRRKYRGNQSL